MRPVGLGPIRPQDVDGVHASDQLVVVFLVEPRTRQPRRPIPGREADHGAPEIALNLGREFVAAEDTIALGTAESVQHVGQA